MVDVPEIRDVGELPARPGHGGGRGEPASGWSPIVAMEKSADACDPADHSRPACLAPVTASAMAQTPRPRSRTRCCGNAPVAVVGRSIIMVFWPVPGVTGHACAYQQVTRVTALVHGPGKSRKSWIVRECPANIQCRPDSGIPGWPGWVCGGTPLPRGSILVTTRDRRKRVCCDAQSRPTGGKPPAPSVTRA
jgi:hypothetical protein